MARHTRRVWLKERKNPKRQNDATRTVSYTLQWKDEKTGKDRFQSLGTIGDQGRRREETSREGDSTQSQEARCAS